MRFFFCFSLSLIALQAFGQPKGEPEAKTRMEGRILSVTGAPIPRATIQIQSLPRRTAEELLNPPKTTADDEGKFVAEGFTPGNYTLQAVKPGFVSQYLGARTVGGAGATVTLAAGQTLTGLEIRMTPQGVVSGRVTSADGDPVERITVALYRDGYVRGRRQLDSVGTNVTDDRGNFRIANIAPGRYFMSAGSAPYAAFENKPVEKNAPREIQVTTFYPSAIAASAAAAIEVTAGSEVTGMNIRMRREKTYTVRARAVDSGGKPVANAALMVNDKNGVFGSATAAALAPARSADGQFTFTGLLPGSYSIVAPNSPPRPDPNGFPPPPNLKGHADVIVTDEDVDLEVRLIPGVDVTATVRAEEGAEEAVKQVRGLTLFEYEIPGFNNRLIQRDPDGVFRGKDVGLATFSATIAPLPRGVYIKSVRFQGQDVTRKPLVLNGSGTIDFLLAAKAADVSGTVRDAAGNIQQAAYVLLWPAVPERSNIDGGARNARTDAAGAFRIDNLAPGEYYLAAWDQGDDGRLSSEVFRALFVSDAIKVKLEESSHLTHDPKPIGVERMNAQFAKLP